MRLVPALSMAIALSITPLLSHCGDPSNPSQLLLPAGDGPGTVLVADLNGDGSLDIAVASERSGTATGYLNDGKGHFSPAPGSPVAAGPNPNDIALADFNKDGRPDLAFANHE